MVDRVKGVDREPRRGTSDIVTKWYDDRIIQYLYTMVDILATIRHHPRLIGIPFITIDTHRQGTGGQHIVNHLVFTVNGMIRF